MTTSTSVGTGTWVTASVWQSIIVACPAVGRGDAELVHDAGGDAGGGVLGAPGGERELGRGAVEPERQPDGAFECGARRQPGARGDVAGDVPDETDGDAELGGHRSDVGAPPGLNGVDASPVQGSVTSTSPSSASERNEMRVPPGV